MAANKAKGLATGMLKWLKKPWQFTGPVSLPEYLDAVSDATDYRKIAPASQPKVIVPQAETAHIFDIKYYPRDRRREPAKTTIVEVVASEGLEAPAPTASTWYVMGKDMPITDEPGGGYQK